MPDIEVVIPPHSCATPSHQCQPTPTHHCTPVEEGKMPQWLQPFCNKNCVSLLMMVCISLSTTVISIVMLIKHANDISTNDVFLGILLSNMALWTKPPYVT